MSNSLEDRFEKIRNTASKDAAAITATKQVLGGESQQLSFVVPTEMVDLPSKGRYYPEGHPLKDATSVEIKQMTAKEEDILTNKSFIKKGVVIDKLIQSLLMNKAIDATSLLVGDKNAIMISARISAYGANYDIGLYCSDCGAKKDHSVDLLEAKMHDVDTIETLKATDETLVHYRFDNGAIGLKLPKSEWLVECKLLTGVDEQRIVSIIENKRKFNEAEEISISEQLGIIIASINGEKDRPILEKAIQCMPASDAKYLRNTYQKLIPNVKISASYVCSACYSKQELEVPFTQEFFWPK